MRPVLGGKLSAGEKASRHLFSSLTTFLPAALTLTLCLTLTLAPVQAAAPLPELYALKLPQTLIDPAPRAGGGPDDGGLRGLQLHIEPGVPHGGVLFLRVDRAGKTHQTVKN